MKKKISVIGAGNWGTTIARLIADNLNNKKELADYDKSIFLWIHDEIVDGKNLSDIINKEKVNVKYLPDIELQENITTTPDLKEAVEDSSILVMVVPHQFYRHISSDISKFLSDDQKQNLIMVSLSKGIEFDEHKKQIKRLTQVFQEESGLKQDNIAALSGPNIASDVATGVTVPTVIASSSKQTQQTLYNIFNNEHFLVELTEHVAAVELGGALKNVVAVGAGVVEGLDGEKQDVIEKGLEEMKKFASYKELGHVADPAVLDGPAGIGDLQVSCDKGRNRKIGVAIGKKWLNEEDFSIEELEKEVLGGQKSQGTGTSREVHEVLVSNNLVDEFPIFNSVYEILFEKKDPRGLLGS
ncbi:glycerol-3-phosphate dehydrogenase (NAD(+)) [Candidatus Woesearchaeota archaeon]|nr:glycerol-3-phosphate dehydrogenase (NAD(+)) [Candidatus Woesearchaeota archaeon]